MGLQNAKENVFHGFWKFGNLALEKVLENFEIIVGGVCTNPGLIYVSTVVQPVGPLLFNWIHFWHL